MEPSFTTGLDDDDLNPHERTGVVVAEKLRLAAAVVEVRVDQVLQWLGKPRAIHPAHLGRCGSQAVAECAVIGVADEIRAWYRGTTMMRYVIVGNIVNRQSARISWSSICSTIQRW